MVERVELVHAESKVKGGHGGKIVHLDYSVNVAQFWQDRVNDESGHGENGREYKRGRVNIRLM